MAMPSAGASVVQVYHGDDTAISYSPVGQNNAAGRMAALRKALQYPAMFPGDHYLVQMGYGTFSVTDHGIQDHGPIIIPANVTLRGMGRGQTTLWSNKQIDKDSSTPGSANYDIAFGPTVCLSDGCVVEDLSVVAECYNKWEDNGAIGFNEQANGWSATLRNCSFKSGDWTIYNWSPGNTLRIDDCDIYGGRVLVAAEDSGVGQTFLADRCRFFGDAKLSVSDGETSNKKDGGVYGVVARGGLVRLTDCEMQLSGSAWQFPDAPTNNVVSATPRVCGVTDHGGGNDGPGSNTRIEIYNLRCSIIPNGSTPERCFDVDIGADFVQKQTRVNWANCWGGSADGTLKRSW
jgi:hypothetical protein